MASADAYKPRPISDDEFLGAFQDLVRRLDRHIQLLDGGDFTFRNDLAAVLRIFLGRDKANQAISRFASRFRQPEPLIRTSPEPSADSGLLLSVGAIPELVDPRGDTHKLSTFLRLKPVLLRTPSGIRQFGWQQIIDDYGNSFGAHLTAGVPQVLDLLQHAGVGSVDFGTYSLRTIGVAASRASHEMLRAVGEPLAVESHPSYFHGAEITQVLYLRDEDGTHDLRAQARKESWTTPGAICAVRTPDGQHLLLSVVTGGKLSLTVR